MTQTTKGNGAALYSDDINNITSINSTQATNILQNINILEDELSATVTVADYEKITWDTYKDDTKVDTATNTFVNTTSNSVILLHDTTSASEEYDFTGVARPSGWTITDGDSGTGSSTLTFDAANDEEDFAGTTGGTYNADCLQTVTDDTTRTHCVIKGAFRNITNNITSGAGDLGTQYVSIGKGASYIRIAATNGGNWLITDSESGSYDTSSTSAPAVVWFKLTIRQDGSVKTEYSLTGDSSYTTLTDAFTGGSVTDVGAYFAQFIDNSNQNRSHTGSSSCFNFTVYGSFVSTGNVTSDSITASSTITLGLITSKTTEPSNTTVVYGLSADNGSNYETVTKNTSYTFDDTGTQLKTKIILNTSDGVSTPIVYFYGAEYL